MKKSYPLARPYIGKKEERYVLEVLRSGKLSMGPKIEAFEKKFAHFVGTKYACGISSGTAGLHVALVAAGIGKGDEVITSPFSFIASANTILFAGATPVFVDVDPVTYNIDPSKIEAAITPKTKAIMPIHIFGQCADMAPIMEIAKKHRLRVIEDACESLGALYGKKMAGTFGEAGVFAFYANKQMTTGEGGMIVTNDKKIYDLSRSLRNQGRGSDMQWLDHPVIGFNYRLDEMSAALGLAQIEKIDFLLRERQKVAAWYGKHLASHADLVIAPHTIKYSTHTWFVYVVQIKDLKNKRDDVIRKLAKVGVASKPYLPSIHLFSIYKKMFGDKTGVFPVSESISESSIALPMYIGLTEADVREICKRLAAILA